MILLFYRASVNVLIIIILKIIKDFIKVFSFVYLAVVLLAKKLTILIIFLISYENEFTVTVSSSLLIIKD